MRTGAASGFRGICLGLASACFVPQQAAAADDAALEAQSVVEVLPKRAKFERERPSHEVRHIADWVVDSGDSRGMPFVIIDKKDARVFVFARDGQLSGAAPALLGMGQGDTALPGIGDRKLSSISPKDRTTPAGRFVAALGVDTHGVDVLWVDYEGAVAMHRVITTNPKERRLQRLASPTPLDNRISYGCINIPVKFYEQVVRPAFTGTSGIVYVLPETKSPRTFFATYDVEERARLLTASRPMRVLEALETTQR
jgi:hypothetical protein